MAEFSPAEALKQARELADKEKTEIKLIRTKASAHGAVTGLVGGLMVGYFKNWNLYVSGLVGIVAGTAISYFLVKDHEDLIKKVKDEKK